VTCIRSSLPLQALFVSAALRSQDSLFGGFAMIATAYEGRLASPKGYERNVKATLSADDTLKLRTQP
jgi:hypothetical protein